MARTAKLPPFAMTVIGVVIGGLLLTYVRNRPAIQRLIGD